VQCRPTAPKVKNYLPNPYAVKACQNSSCLRGQRLFIRPIDSSDADAIRAFLTANGAAGDAPACGLVAKLVGDIVAVMAFDIDDATLQVSDLVVAQELRRKRIGRYVVDEAARLAAKLERAALIVADGRGADAFLLRVGFVSEDGLFVRRVG
jgi:GNAT superfamily N-acetyltransferase